MIYLPNGEALGAHTFESSLELNDQEGLEGLRRSHHSSHNEKRRYGGDHALVARIQRHLGFIIYPCLRRRPLLPSEPFTALLSVIVLPTDLPSEKIELSMYWEFDPLVESRG